MSLSDKINKGEDGYQDDVYVPDLKASLKELKESIMEAYHKKQNPFFIFDEIFGAELNG